MPFSVLFGLFFTAFLKYKSIFNQFHGCSLKYKFSRSKLAVIYEAKHMFEDIISQEEAPQNCEVTMEVDIDLSALEIQTCEEGSSESPNSSLQSDSAPEEAEIVRRSGRKRIKPLKIPEKRRVVTRPRKLNINSSMKDIENYYLDKKVKVSSPALETIFEEPKKDILMGTRRLRRSITFSEIVSEKPDKNKVKKRSLKAKKLNNRFKKFGKKIGLELLMSKLKDLDSEDR